MIFQAGLIKSHLFTTHSPLYRQTHQLYCIPALFLTTRTNFPTHITDLTHLSQLTQPDHSQQHRNTPLLMLCISACSDCVVSHWVSHPLHRTVLTKPHNAATCSYLSLLSLGSISQCSYMYLSVLADSWLHPTMQLYVVICPCWVLATSRNAAICRYQSLLSPRSGVKVEVAVLGSRP